MHIVILAYGTRGDVQPTIALGRALQNSGHRVCLLASQNFREWIQGYGLEAAPTTVDTQAVMSSEGGGDWIEHGNSVLRQARVMRRLAERHGPQMVADAWEATAGADALISEFMAIHYAGTLAAQRGIPHVRVLLQPSVLPTRDGRATILAPQPHRPSRLNDWPTRWIVNPLMWRLYGDILNTFRQKTLELPAMSNSDFVADLQRTPLLFGYSPHVVPHPADWPATTHTTGYWFLSEGRNWQPPAGLEEFLAAGEPPVCIGFGSMTGRNVDAMSQLMAEAVRLSGRRAVVLSGWAGLGSGAEGGPIYRLQAAPHDWLFPRVAAVVHHGGAGTTAAGLRAGVPNIVVPHMTDQPFWGRRVAELGVGPRPIPRPKLTAATLAAAIRQATSDDGMRARAAELGRLIAGEDGLGVAVRLCEHYLCAGAPARLPAERLPR